MRFALSGFTLSRGGAGAKIHLGKEWPVPTINQLIAQGREPNASVAQVFNCYQVLHDLEQQLN